MLPIEFTIRMKNLLNDYDDFVSSFNDEAIKAIRVNTNKISVENFLKINPFNLKPIPYTKDGFYIAETSIGNHPYHHAGLFYSQDPAAMMPVNCLTIDPSWTVLDLCASPGGKSTQIASLLTSGILVSNEINYNRAKVLFGNIERMGLTNTIVLNNDAYTLSKKYHNTFDCIFIDAPCSGEGMFRKDIDALKTWSLKKIEDCSNIQKELLKNADLMLKEGGFLVYSTCTYSLEENELMLTEFLKNPDYEVLEVPETIKKYTKPGFINDEINKELKKAVRFYPHVAPGEGQFCAILHKKGTLVKNEILSTTTSLIDQYIKNDVEIKLNISRYQDKFFNKINFDISNLNIISGGVQLGELINNRFIYHHNFATAYGLYFKNKLNLDLNDERVYKYLHGEEITGDVSNGYGVILVSGYPLGLFKATNGVLKNHYPKGLRVVK